MRVPHRTAHVISLLVVLAWAQGLEAKKSKKQICPIGFKLAYNKFRGDFVCYKRKELEPFSAALDDCDGNLYSSKLYRSLNISKLDYSNTLWAEYKSFYPGGPFVSWSRNEEDWVVVNEVDDYQPPSLRYDTDQELCLVVDRVGGYIAVQCDDKYYRYCLVKPYSDREDMTKRGCEAFKGSWRFDSSKDICLLGVTGVAGGTVRATWNQSQALCSKHGGTLLSRGWQYANMPLFHISDVSPTPTYPLGIVWDPEKRVLRYVSEDSVVEKPFEMGSLLNETDDTMFIAIRDESWVAVNSSYIFFDVICEHSVSPRNLSLTLSINSDNKIILDVNDSVDKDDIHCTTDSESYRPSKVKIHHDDDEDNYVLSPATDGYYWCEHVDRYNFQTTQSNKVLFVRERDSLINLYTVKINLINDNYTFSNADDRKEEWIDLLEEYVFYRTRYVQTFDDDKILDPNRAEEILKNFKKSRTELSWRDGEEIYNSVIKRLYVNRKTVLLHVELNPEMIPVTPGTWGNIEVLFMKSAYYCKGFDSVPRLSLGETTVSRGCRTYSCIGNFNEGVQWIESMTADCTPTTFVPMGAYLTISDVTVRTPTVLPQVATTRSENLEFAESELEGTEDVTSEMSDIHMTDAPSRNTTESSSEETVEVNTTTFIPDEVITVTTTMKRCPPTPTTTTETVVTSTLPTTPDFEPTLRPPLAPDEQLVHVLQELEQLLNDTVPLTMDRVGEAFDQVNIILEVDQDLDIPGELLHMLDEIGNRINLNGSGTAQTVRGNIALLMADTAPDNPVRGVRMALMDPGINAFTDQTFEFIGSEMNSTQLTTNQSEAVVYLPESVTNMRRRISFLVYRNERAFRGNQDVLVNSRVVSVNVENVTEFDAGEVIDIYLAPMNEDPDSNVSRACAYWHFLENASGYWSTEGCVFIKSTECLMCCEEPGNRPNFFECKCCHTRNRRDIDQRPQNEFQERSTKINKIFGAHCDGSTFSIVTKDLVLLLYNPDLGWSKHPFSSERQCTILSKHFIQTYINQSSAKYIRPYKNNLTEPFFKKCYKNLSRNLFCFCCMLNGFDQGLDTQTIDYWDQRLGISPITGDDEVLKVVENWMDGTTPTQEDSAKDIEIWYDIMENETTTFSPDDFEDYIGETEPLNDYYQQTMEPLTTLLPTERPQYTADVALEKKRTTLIYEKTSTMKYETTTEFIIVDQEQVLEDLENLLLNETAITMEIMEGALDSVNLLFEDDSVNVTGDLLLAIDQLGPRLDLEGSPSAAVVRDNLALIVVEANPEHPVRGLRITTERNDTFNNDSFDFISGEDYSQYLSSNESDAVVSLPSSIMDSHLRMSFVVFRDDRAFRHTPGMHDSIVNSRILSVNVDNVTSFGNGETINIYLRPTKTNDRHQRRACAYWRFLEDGTGYWSEDGCTFIKTTETGMLDTCQCNHLTHFAEVLIAVNRFSEENETILEILSITGCCLSILGISLVIVTAIVFQSWRKDFSNKIWLQLCLAIFILNVCFLIKAFADFEQDIWCMLAGIIMHYSLLVSFFWMLVAAIISYINLVLVFKTDITRKLLKSSLFAWGSPLLIIGILLAVNSQSYMNKFEDTSRTSSFCYPSGLSLWLSVFLPLSIILLINWSLFIAILYSMFKRTEVRRHGNSKDALRSAVVSSLLVFLLGLPWVFGLIAYNIIAAYIFTITVTFQGFILFLFFIVANKRTRDLWVKKLRTDRGRSMPTSMATESTSAGRAGPSVELKPFGAVQLRESDEIKSLLQRGVSLPGAQYTRPDEKPDEYYE